MEVPKKASIAEQAVMKVPRSMTECALAAQSSTDVIRRAVDRGELLAVRKTSGERLVDPDDLERWLRVRKKRAAASNESSVKK